MSEQCCRAPLKGISHQDTSSLYLAVHGATDQHAGVAGKILLQCTTRTLYCLCTVRGQPHHTRKNRREKYPPLFQDKTSIMHKSQMDFFPFSFRQKRPGLSSPPSVWCTFTVIMSFASNTCVGSRPQGERGKICILSSHVSVPIPGTTTHSTKAPKQTRLQRCK